MRLLCVLALALLPGDGEHDVVVLQDGRSLKGRVVYEDRTTLVLRQGTREVELEQKKVERVDSLVRNLGALLDNDAHLVKPDVRALELLAAEAEESGLPGEEQVFWWRILALDPEHEAAHRALGHRRRGDGWSFPSGAAMVGWERRLEQAKDWGSAWEFTSLHYHLRSNLPLDQNLFAALDLERFYRGYYGLFGGDLRLFDVTRPMNVCLHADSASYPETATEHGHYEPETDIVQVDASRGLEWLTLAHELAHQLLWDTAFREKNDSGEIPSWLDEGLAEYVAGCVRGGPGAIEVVAGEILSHHFQAHAHAREPLDLARVLALSSGDFQATSDRDLKYAEAYTLVHFLLDGAEGRYRAGFLEYLRTIYHGRGSSTDLKKCLKVDWRVLEKAWTAYVRAKAG